MKNLGSVLDVADQKAHTVFMTTTQTTTTFTCHTCHDQFFTMKADATECGYCRAARESAERIAAGQCGYGCKVLDNECHEQLHDGECHVHGKQV